MKNFDEDRSKRHEADRSFKIGGEEFVRRVGVRPDILSRWDDVDNTTPNGEALTILDALLLEFIEPGEAVYDDDQPVLDEQGEPVGVDQLRWKKLRQRRDDPVTLLDLMELVNWLVAESAGRPTVPRSGSSDGRGETTAPSTGGSS